MEDLLAFIKEQLEIGNYGRVVRNAIKIIDADDIGIKLEAYLLKADAELEQGFGEEAIRSYTDAINLFPKEFDPRFHKALTLIDLLELDSAKNELDQLNTLFPKNLDVLNNLIYVEELNRNHLGIIHLCDHILSFSDPEYTVLLSKSTALMEIGKFDEAINLAKSALVLDGLDEFDLAMGYNDLGYYYSRKMDFESAKIYLNKSLDYDIDEFALNNLGWVLATLGEIDKGLNLVNQCIELNSQNSYAFKNRAKIHLLKHDNELAKQDLLRAKKLFYKEKYGGEVDDLLSKLGVK